MNVDEKSLQIAVLNDLSEQLRARGFNPPEFSKLVSAKGVKSVEITIEGPKPTKEEGYFDPTQKYDISLNRKKWRYETRKGHEREVLWSLTITSFQEYK